MCGTQALIRALTTLHELKDSAVKVLRKLYRWERCRVRVEGPKCSVWILLVTLIGLAPLCADPLGFSPKQDSAKTTQQSK